MAGTKKIRVVLAEDHPVVRQGIVHMLEQADDIEVVGEAGNGEEALKLLKDLQPDVLICDIRMPVLNGIEVIRRMKQYSPETRALVLSAYDDDEYVIEAIALGATGYVMKTADSKEFSETVRRIQSGQLIIHPSVAAKLPFLIGGALPRAGKEPAGVRDILTAKEQEIIRLAAMGLRNKVIAEKLGISVRTVEGHFSRIFTKLSVSSRAEAVLAVQPRSLREADDQ